MLKGKCVALCLTGGIAAYKAAEIASRLVKMNADVVCVMTKNATEFITPLTIETLTRNPVVKDMFERPATWEVEHIALARRADLFLVAPATANIIAKMAVGIADDFLSTTLLATPKPILVAPAMNSGMYQHPATQQNIETLKQRGVKFVGPGIGRLADAQSYGIGRLTEIDEILDAAISILLPKKDLEGLKVMVTAGGTQEPIDPVRFLTNRSSGKMGFALAEAARDRGAQVTLLCGNVSAPIPGGVTVERFATTQQLHDLATGLAKEMDLVLQAAAPGDYRAESVADQKIKKQGDQVLELRLVPNPDVAAALGATKRPGQILVCFAAETADLIENAKGKLARKNCDLVVANDVSKPGAGFNVDTNIAALVTRDAAVELPLLSKRELADAILDKAMELRG